MLFLAVFLGFIAENIRESIVEKERGKQYIESFYRDLKKDTAAFSRIIAADYHASGPASARVLP